MRKQSSELGGWWRNELTPRARLLPSARHKAHPAPTAVRRPRDSGDASRDRPAWVATRPRGARNAAQREACRVRARDVHVAAGGRWHAGLAVFGLTRRRATWCESMISGAVAALCLASASAGRPDTRADKEPTSLPLSTSSRPEPYHHHPLREPPASSLPPAPRSLLSAVQRPVATAALESDAALNPPGVARCLHTGQHTTDLTLRLDPKRRRPASPSPAGS